ncbi:hypothetical protein [Salinigranum halophilum]|uniref:hypothetical protein n=1 Tax=Salinigranum halophilum TaxID=2565931 RepID=UPI00191C626F|nr:hypothetical protein [Salinigranum halophilum]
MERPSRVASGGPGARRPATRWFATAFVALAALVATAGVAAAHGGAVRGAARESLAVPTWLFLLTGGGVVGASFLLASFVTDRAFIASIHAWRRALPAPARLLSRLGQVAGVVSLVAVVVLGFVGPDTPTRNLAILVVWVGWWGGYVASTYLVGNTWPSVNPFRTLASPLPSLDRPYPERFGTWPSVVGLLALVWLEVTSPLAEDPVLLSTVVVAYTVVTLAGAVVFGTDTWFSMVDPLSRALRYYGRVAPVERTDEGLRLRLPGAALSETRLVTGRDEVAFVVAILFVTTYDGLIATELWAGVVRTVVGVGVPPLAVYLGAYLAGFGLFLVAYDLATAAARRTCDTYLSAAELGRRFAPALLAIAAGYHLAHNLGTVLTLTPTFLQVLAAPLSPPANPTVLVVPGWFTALDLGFVLAGHLVAVWVAHATAYDLFPSRLQAVHSQYGVTAVMIAYTMVSLWVIAEPFVAPPFLST